MKTSLLARALSSLSDHRVSLFCSQGVSCFIRYVHRAAYATRSDARIRISHEYIARSLLAERSTGAGALSSVSCCNGNVAFARATRLTDPPIYIPVFRSHSTGFKSSRVVSSPENDMNRSVIFADTRDPHFESNRKKKNCLTRHLEYFSIIFHYT